ncbi:MAG: Adenine DNA glycosylase [Flavobacteriaceae bacterium]|nr:MAG: Adenine DNA glycosylase [Flavobacteriaceae bacterium]
MAFHQKLLYWYDENRRSFPWRDNKDPYRVWLSEIILQQTRAAQGLPYYEAFIIAFPTIKDLAQASEDQVLKLWQGLGYYTRARNLHATAKIVVDRYGGNFPVEFQEIKKLKGIGDYTASAISSICFQQPQAVVDGNVYRVLSRIFGIDLPIDGSSAHKHFKNKAQQLMRNAPPGDFNQALMEFGALQCTPKNPGCEHCIFKSECVAFKNEKVALLPVKIKKIKIQKRYFHYVVLTDASKSTLLEKRTGKGIWQNLYQFPLIETDSRQNTLKKHSIDRLLAKKNIDDDYVMEKWNEKAIFHKLTHQHLEINFWIVRLSNCDILKTNSSSLKDFPMPRVLQNFRDNFFTN